MTDVVIGGTVNSKTPKEVQELFVKMAMNSYQWNNLRIISRNGHEWLLIE